MLTLDHPEVAVLREAQRVWTGKPRARCEGEISRELSVWDGYGRLPDRGRRQRGWAWTVDLGHVQPHGGQGPPWRHGRHRLRPLPSPGGRPRPDVRARDAGLPLLRGLAPCSARGEWSRQPQRPRPLQAPRRWFEGTIHRADPHALPLGPAAGARRTRRMDEQGDERALRRVRGDSLRVLIR